MEEKRNPRPVEESSKLPTITLTVLVGIIGALLFVGWQYLSDNSISDNELTNISSDSLSIVGESSSLPELKEEGESKESSDDEEEVAPKEKSEGEASDDEASQPEKKKPLKEEKSTKTTDADLVKGTEISHTVQAGETFYGIANRYNLKWQTLQKLNPGIEPNGIKVGVTKLKVKIRTIHTVGAGDVLRVVADKYGISKELLMQANKKKKDFAERGERLIVPLK